MSSSYSKYLLIGLPIVTLAGIGTLWWQRREKKGSYTEVGRVRELWIYPVKACKGIQLTEAKCFKEGMEYDRRWIILGEDDVYLTQRKDPKLALVVPSFEDDKYLCLDAPGMATLKVDVQPDKEEFKKIKVKTSYGEGRYVGDEAAAWISTYLEKPGCKIYQLSKTRVIEEDQKWGNVAQPGDMVSFSDFAPYLITTDASLDALNGELPKPISMARFRPNIIISGPKAFEEDEWARNIIQIGDIKFRFLKRCGRCQVVTVDPILGMKDGEEPLTTLRRIRLPEDRDPRQLSPLFGNHVTLEGDKEGVISLGQAVMVIS